MKEVWWNVQFFWPPESVLSVVLFFRGGGEIATVPVFSRIVQNPSFDLLCQIHNNSFRQSSVFCQLTWYALSPNFPKPLAVRLQDSCNDPDVTTVTPYRHAGAIYFIACSFLSQKTVDISTTLNKFFWTQWWSYNLSPTKTKTQWKFT